MKNIPNILTLSRIVFSVIVLLLLLHGEDFQIIGFMNWALCIFILASITDFFDGYLARRYGVTSNFGEVFDPLADKMLILSGFIGLMTLGLANPWLVFIILAREFFVTGLRVIIAGNGKDIRAGVLGKIKTVLQIIAISFLLLESNCGFILLWVATLVTLYSGIDYAWKYYQEIR